ncbi:protein clarinet-like isoform X10 [Homarus americanus]|uniref:protein clarinet-like isoform X10 n=1 Tax=Homarus americanus TaxID=6706 RepID=UPI001C48FA92|nr:protein clarinet-like isoform X10 [Homarus americanus]
MPGNVRYGGQNPPHPTPTRAMSLDSLHDKNANLDSKAHEYIPSRITRTTPKINEAAMQFVKTGPAVLYKSATEQIKKAEAVKAMRQHLIAEEADWQEQPSSSSSSSKNPYDEGSDWQSNLDKWKSSRRKRNEEALERVIEIKKNEQEEELIRTRRKSKTFSEIQGDKSKRGRRYNLVVHNDDDNNDLSGLGLSSAKSTSSLSDAHEENDVKDLDQDNKDAKSDAGFCTGSDTGSDGVFAEDNISDTSSALGDKKEAHDSLLDTGVSKEEETHINGHGSSLITEVFHSTSTSVHTDEYTYDKAIAGYKQYAENSAKKRTSSITSLNSNTSYTKEEDRKNEKPRLNGRSPSPSKSNKVEEKLNFFSKEREKDFRISPEPRVIMREKSPKVDVGKRRSMFEIRDPTPIQNEREQKLAYRRSLEVSNSLRNKVASFENLESETPKIRGVTPTRDTNLRSKVASFENLDIESTKVHSITPTRDAKFQEKRATFATKDYESQPVRKKTPERDINFHKKLASFNSIENGDEEKVRERKTIPQGDPTLKNKIASFEQLEQLADLHTPSHQEEMLQSRDRSVSLERLDQPQVKEVKMRPTRSMMNILRRTPSTPYMVVDLEGSRVEEKCVMQRKSMVNAQVFEIASKLEETPLLGSPIQMAPIDPLPVYQTHEDDSLEATKPYTDDDINEVICDYEQVGGSYEDSSACAENIYENITEEPMYENIYEKVDDDHNESKDSVDHHYQTLEEVREEVQVNTEHARLPPSPVTTIPTSPLVLDSPEVLDVTWTDGPSQAAPPSEPPPPPPPDDDSDIDASDQPQSLPTEEEEAFTRVNSTRRLKKELWRRRSDFLGTSSQYIEEAENTVKPPPDLSHFLRQEREAERGLLESQVSKSSPLELLSEAEITRREREIIENLERSEQLQQQQYIWEDHRQDDGQTLEKNEIDEHMQYQEKLAELEEEMMRHDKDMLRRTGQLQAGPAAVSDSQPTHIPPPTPYASHEESAVPLHQISPSIENSSYNFQPQSSSHLPIQEFYTAPTYDSTPPASLVQAEGITGYRPQGHKTVTLPSGSPSQYSTLASPHPFSRSNSQSTIEAPKHTPVHAVRSTPLASPRESIPEPLPRKNKVPPPAPNKSQKINSDLNTTERHEAIRSSRMPTSESLMAETEQPESQGPSVSPSGQQMSKQTLLALSAIPKPRLTDNESWITKKKPDAQKRDYSKHWLHQEAEQRRLEQMDRISRQKVPVSQPQLKSPQNVSPQHTPQHSSPSQTTSYLPTQNTPSYPPQNTTPTYSSYPQALKNPSPSHNCNNNNNNNNASWRNQATTYQPHMPSPAPNGDKALPDSIIHNLTQRVNNKNNKNTYSNTSGRLGNNYGNNFRDENYHDYMNADALSASHTHAPLYQSGMGPGQPSPPSSQQDVNSAQDQRLLSVSGKKKCSHCSEELGRGAAMIIESLRLFYHIPCFKCCVCGIQLGNGSAGADVRVRNHKLHCHNCYSNDEGMKFSKV